MRGVFRGGMSTEFEVNLLLKTFSVEPGMKVSYEDVCDLTKIRPNEGRFRAVTNAWRKRIFREKLISSTAEGGSFHFLTADEAHDRGLHGMQKIGRAMGRLCTRVESINAEQLTGERRERHNLLRRESQAVLEIVRASQKVIAGPRPVSSTRLRLAKS